MNRTLNLILLNDTFSISRLEPDNPIPDWAQGTLVSVTRTRDELSVVCPDASVPVGVRCERGWSCFRVAGNLDFSLVGVLMSIVSPLANAGISVFCVSTFDTDYVLIKEADLEKGVSAIEESGIRVNTE